MPIASSKITSKGQITLPAKLRQQLGLKAGDRLDFERNKQGKFELVAKTHTFEDLQGMLPYKGARLTNKQIVEMVRQGRDEMADGVFTQVFPRK